MHHLRIAFAAEKQCRCGGNDNGDGGSELQRVERLGSQGNNEVANWICREMLVLRAITSAQQLGYWTLYLL